MNLPTTATATATATMTAPEEAPVLDTAAEVRETHTGLVVLIGDRAYKMKKPVLTDFLDFRTPEAREQACARELTLNSRMAPDAYLGIAHLTLPDRVAPEPMVVMRRYPDRYRLGSMVLRGEPTEPHLDALADLLSGFHAHATRSPRNNGRATAPALAALWRENLDELGRHAPAVLDPEKVSEVGHLAMRYINGRSRLFGDRVTAGRVVDGHGDLMAEDIFCTPDGPVPLDCLEFDDQLRHVDGIDDAAFLAMDLEFLGRADLAAHFLDRYRAAAGDTAPRSLIDFYIAYRAVVRAKVDCIKLSQGHRGSDADARFHLDLALAHLRESTVRLIIVGGGPGTGKTTLSTALATSLSAQSISTDDLRRELRDTGELVGEAGAVDAGLYASENVALVYNTMLDRAGQSLAAGESVILDGTWRDPKQRQRARETAAEANAVMVEIACTTDLSGAQQRISARTSTTSDATAHIAAAITAKPWAGAHCVDTGRPLAESLAEAQQICCLAI